MSSPPSSAARQRSLTRRSFVRTAAGTAAAATVFPAPRVVTTAKADDRIILGQGEHRYQVLHDWPQLPDRYTWQTTHNVAVDKAGNLYVIHEGREDLKDHPSIFVFDPQGKFIRAFGERYQGGGHGIEVREESGQEFLYVCAYQQVKAFSKLDLKGEVVWHQHAPMDSGVYAAGEDTHPQKVWGRDRFMPTNFAFMDSGDFYLADGYGSFYVHLYDKDGNWKAKFGGPGAGEGKFETPHGIWIDNRPGRTGGKPSIVVCDRAHHTLQFLDLSGGHLQTLTGYGLPANIDTWKNLMLVPELHARLTLLNEHNEVVAHLGDDVARVTSEQGIRDDRARWIDGKFVHPHDACFDRNGDIFVAEWVATGRVSKLVKLS